MLAGDGADQLALLAPVCNFTVLHAAVLGGCVAVLRQFTAACAAAGVPVDAQLQLGDGVLLHPGWTPELQFFRDLGVQNPGRLAGTKQGATPLSIAVW